MNTKTAKEMASKSITRDERLIITKDKLGGQIEVDNARLI